MSCLIHEKMLILADSLESAVLAFEKNKSNKRILERINLDSSSNFEDITSRLLGSFYQSKICNSNPSRVIPTEKSFFDYAKRIAATHGKVHIKEREDGSFGAFARREPFSKIKDYQLSSKEDSVLYSKAGTRESFVLGSEFSFELSEKSLLSDLKLIEEIFVSDLELGSDIYFFDYYDLFDTNLSKLDLTNIDSSEILNKYIFCFKVIKQIE